MSEEEETYRGIAVESLTEIPIKTRSPQPGDLIQTMLGHVLVKKNIAANGSVWYEERRQPRGSFLLCVGHHKFLWEGEVVEIQFQGSDWRLIKKMTHVSTHEKDPVLS